MIRRAVLAVGLACAPALATAAPDDAPDGAMPPGLRAQVFQHSRSSFALQRGDIGDAARSPLLQQLAQGTLLRAQLSDDANLMLRLRGGRVGLYLAVRLDGRD